ncbi:hypothetical protein SLE2022_265520 [Rubroshorea leprosula]
MERKTRFHQSTKDGHRLSPISFGNGSSSTDRGERSSVARTSSAPTLPISVFWLIPQHFLVGSGEAFIYTAQLDFFITQSPKGVKTMSTGLFLTTLSFGFFVSCFLVVVVKKVTEGRDGQGWLADNINHGRLYCFYGLLAILGIINFAIYLVCAV